MGNKIKSIFSLFIVVLWAISSNAYCQVTSVSPTSNEIKQIQQLINQNNGQEALIRVANLLKQQPSFELYVLAAQSQAILNQPQNALISYQRALSMARTETEKRIGVFGVAKMQLWLGQYQLAEHNYRYLLGTQLNEQDRITAQNGLARSQNQGRLPNRSP